MKNLLLTLFVLGFTSGLSAQKLEVVEVKDKINGNVVSALSFSSAEGDKSLFEKEWKKLMKKYKGKQTRGDEIIFINPEIPGLYNDTLVVYAIVRTRNVGIEFTAAFEIRNGFVSSTAFPQEYGIAQKLLYDFALETTKSSIRDAIKEQQKELKQQERELSSLQSEKKKLEEDILKYEKQIEQAKADIEKNIKDQEAKQKEIDSQKQLIEGTEKRLKEVK